MNKFIEENTNGFFSNEYRNGISYRFYTMKDGWIAIIEICPYKGMIPVMQCLDRETALEYISLIEPINIPVHII